MTRGLRSIRTLSSRRSTWRYGFRLAGVLEGLLAIADRVIGSNADEGLAAFLDELVERHVVEPLKEDEESGHPGYSAERRGDS